MAIAPRLAWERAIEKIGVDGYEKIVRVEKVLREHCAGFRSPLDSGM